MLGRFPALAGADLDVEAGEIVLLAGPNGAGKTTLLRLCAGLLPLRSGHAEVLGVDLAVDRRAMRRSLALVGHETFCYDDLTVARERALRDAGGRADGAADADAALERLGLERVARRHARAPVAGAAPTARRSRSRSARDPRLLLLDEPHAGLDEQGRAVLDDVVRAAPAEGRTVLIASHELDRARPLATREVRISAGQVHAIRPARDGGAPLAPCLPARRGVRVSFFREAMLVAGKDLRIERRSRVALQQILPFGAIVVVMFAFALDADRHVAAERGARPLLGRGAARRRCSRSGGRSRSRRPTARATDCGCRGLDGGSVFLGKAAAIAVELFLLEIVLGVAVVVLYDVTVHGVLVLLCAAVAATIGLAATGTVYGVLATGSRARDTLVPCSCSRRSRR